MLGRVNSRVYILSPSLCCIGPISDLYATKYLGIVENDITVIVYPFLEYAEYDVSKCLEVGNPSQHTLEQGEQ